MNEIKKELNEMYFNDLKEYCNSYSIRNLHYMSQFAAEFSNNEIMQQPVAQIPWFTIVIIMQKSKSNKEMLYYINERKKLGF